MTLREEPVSQEAAAPLNKSFLINCLNAYNIINNANKIHAAHCPLGVFCVMQGENIAGDREQQSDIKGP